MATDPPMVLSNSETVAPFGASLGGCAHEDEKGRN
jgi:hypothetical protein